MLNEYMQTKYHEAKEPCISNDIWSGDDVHKLPFRRKREVFHSLNNIDKLIYMNGVKGLLVTIQKYTIWMLRLKEVDMFFDLCIAVNIVFLTFTGIIDE
jgi:hypothetical protein